MSSDDDPHPAGDRPPTGMPGGDDAGEQETPMGPGEPGTGDEPEPGSGDMPGIVEPGEEPPSDG